MAKKQKTKRDMLIDRLVESSLVADGRRKSRLKTGMDRGTAWAERFATYEELHNLTLVKKQHGPLFLDKTDPDTGRGSRLFGLIGGEESDARALRSFLQAVVGDRRKDVLTHDEAFGFVEAALKVWDGVRDDVQKAVRAHHLTKRYVSAP